jgi:hypothetical protein
MHDKGRVHKLILSGEVKPNLPQDERIGLVLVNQWEVLTVDNALTSSHPLKITTSVSSGIALRVGVVSDALESGSNSFKATMGMLRESRYLLTVVHTPALARIEVLTVADTWSLHILVSSGVVILVVHKEEEWVRSRSREAHGVNHFLDRRSHWVSVSNWVVHTFIWVYAIAQIIEVLRDNSRK